MSTFSPALQPVPRSAAAIPASVPSYLSLVTPEAPRLNLVMPGTAASPDTKPHAADAPTGPRQAALIVSRDSHAERGTCALCWTGPEQLAGTLRSLDAPDEHKAICSRCLVSLEMLATLFESELRLHIETPA